MDVNLRFHLVKDIKLGKMKENVLAAELLQLDDKGAFDQYGKFQEYRAIGWKIQYKYGRPG